MQQLHPVIQRLFEKKGLNQKSIESFLSWDLKALPDLTQLKDLGKASKRIIEAIGQKQKIGVYGDYDVDGTTSCALLYHFFKMLNVEVDIVQPSRFIEGYGLHLSSIDEAVEKNISVLITVDCGITNNEAADSAKTKGLDLIITDHHKDARDSMPDAYAVINPNRRDELEQDIGELKTLAGVAVAFALAVQIRADLALAGRSIPSLYPLLQFVAIGTICDLAHLSPANLKLVRHGLRQLKETQFPGLRAFFTADELKAKTIPSEKLAFHIGPLINSKGRLDHPELALQLLIASSQERARECYDQLVSCNQERKFIQNEVSKEARDQVLQERKNLGYKEHLITIVYQPHWHEGVIGIVASKMVDTFKAPAIIFTDSELPGVIKASCRSAGTLDIFNLLKQNEHLFIKFGGHKAAAGLSMKKENLREFIDNMNRLLSKIPAIERTRMEFYDLEIDAFEINPQLMRDLDLLEPFGMGNEKPVFKIKGVHLDSFDIMKEAHVRWNLSYQKTKLKGISFNYVGKYEAKRPEEIFSTQNLKHEDLSVYFTLGLNRFNGNESIQLMIDRLEFGGL
ncbi:MAG: single-stranded-DNA-specific exonuclease RecJ [Bacteriovorax sp.]|jgi:single-stranded-DNA-specific exonuclease